MFAATLPVIEPIRPLEITATCAPPERIFVDATIAASMIVLIAPNASIKPPKMVNNTIVFADTDASIPYTPVKFVVTYVIKREKLKPE